MRPKILIVDDEKLLRDTLAEWFAGTYDCLTAPDAEQAMKAIGENPDLALMISDVKMPPDGERSGVELLKKAKAANPGMACILLTAYGTVDLAVEAMKIGADDFFQKPVTDLAQFELRVAKAIKTASLEKEVAELKSQLSAELENFTGKSPAMEKVYRLIRKAAPATANVLVEGPSGTGKELVARALHNLSRRANGPFVAVECAALPANLLESELFGYEKGAFTDARQRKIGRFEAADGGTLFLDEIGEIDQSTQVKLLRAIESRTIQRIGGNEDIPVDFRLVAATNRDLRALVDKGDFREDLYYRLNVIDIRLPALKDRSGDIALLASRFLREFSAANGNVVKGIDAKAMKALEDYSWPGNVRQLRNVIEKMVVLASSDRLTLDDVPVEVLGAECLVPGAVVPGAVVPDAWRVAGPAPSTNLQAPSTQHPAPSTKHQAPSTQHPVPSTQHPAPSTNHQAPTASLSLADSEKAQILAALAAHGNNKTAAATALGISRRTLHRKLNEWGLQ